jgi:hypothetical protein
MLASDDRRACRVPLAPDSPWTEAVSLPATVVRECKRRKAITRLMRARRLLIAAAAAAERPGTTAMRGRAGRAVAAVAAGPPRSRGTSPSRIRVRTSNRGCGRPSKILVKPSRTPSRPCRTPAWVMKSASSAESLTMSPGRRRSWPARGALRRPGRFGRLPSSWALLFVGSRSLDDDEERLVLLDDVRGELGRLAAADVPDGVNRLGGDHQRLAGVVGLRLAAVDRVLQRPF